MSEENTEEKKVDTYLKKHSWWQRFLQSLKTPTGKKRFIIILIIALAIIFAGTAVYIRYFKPELGGSLVNSGKGLLPNINYSQPEEVKKEVSKLEGNLYATDIANRHPLAIMVENHTDARPQSGLDKASIVYEAIAEGGITRFMAVFGPEGADKVGPVRSARTYYLDWALEYDAFYAHVGGNIDALDLIPKIGLKDLDQFRYGTQAYWREPQKNKATEHTMYTSTDKLYDIAKNNDWDISKSDFTMLDFKEDLLEAQRPTSQTISIDFSTAAYKVSWDYDQKTNSYKRSMAGSAHKDAQTGNQLTAKNVIAQEVNRQPTITRINESGWEMDTIGSGKAKIFLDGKTIEGSWEKKDRSSRTIFYDTTGAKIKFNPGKFWLEIVPPGTPVSVS